MNSQKTIYLSKKGMKELKKAVSRLEHEIKNAHAQLRDIDKTDGHDERFARAELVASIEMLDSELDEKRRTLTQAKLFPRKRDAIKVAIGSVVDLIDMNGRLIRYTIVESIEADPSDGRISIKSPLGQNLVGKQIHDVIEWSTGLRTNHLRLVGIG